MDNMLIIIVLAIAILAIVALPRVWRGRRDEAGDSLAPPPVTREPAQSQFHSASALASVKEIDADPFTRWLCDQARAQTGINLRNDPLALTRLAEAAAKARVEIGNSGETEISLPYITADASGPKHFALTITRAQLARIPGQMV
jgi:hypothetical protein